MHSTKSVFENVDLIYNRHNFYSNVKSVTKTTILFNELTIVIKGKMNYIVNGIENIVTDGCAIFIPYGSERIRLGNTTADFISFNFVDKNDYSSFNTITKNFIDDEVISFLKVYDLINQNNKGNVYEKIAYVVNALLIKMFDFYNAPKYSKLTLSIINYLEEHILDKIELKEIEDIVYFTSNYFNKVFKNETGYSIIKYYNKLKLEKAKALITEQEMSFEEISIHLGFSDYNYFSRLFRKTYNITPSTYKNKFIQKNSKYLIY